LIFDGAGGLDAHEPLWRLWLLLVRVIGHQWH
jgi:hypothetical protein